MIKNANVSNKRRLMILGSLALISCLGAVCVTRAQGQAVSANAWSAYDANEKAAAGLQSANHANSEVVKKMVYSILGVVIVGSVAIWASKKYLPKLTATRGKHIRVLESVQLAPQRAVHVIEVGSQKFLIGSSAESVRMLADVTLAMSEEDLQQEEIHAPSN